MRPRFIFVYGNQSTHWSFAWAPWLKAELEALGFETFFETMPDSVIARSEYWLPFLKEHVMRLGSGMRSKLIKQRSHLYMGMTIRLHLKTSLNLLRRSLLRNVSRFMAANISLNAVNFLNYLSILREVTYKNNITLL